MFPLLDLVMNGMGIGRSPFRTSPTVFDTLGAILRWVAHEGQLWTIFWTKKGYASYFG